MYNKGSRPSAVVNQLLLEYNNTALHSESLSFILNYLVVIIIKLNNNYNNYYYYSLILIIINLKSSFIIIIILSLSHINLDSFLDQSVGIAYTR